MEHINSFGQFWFWQPWQLLFAMLVTWNVPRLPYYNAWYMKDIHKSFEPNTPIWGGILARIGTTFALAMFFILSINFTVFLLTHNGAH